MDSAESIPQEGVLFKGCSSLLAECGSQAQTPRASGVHGYTATPIAHGLEKETIVCKLLLPTFKAFLCFYCKRTVSPSNGFPLYFTISSKLPPRKPEHSPAADAENYADAKSTERQFGNFHLRMLPIELSYSGILLD